MSLEFIDGFDHYNTQPMLQRKWDNTSVCDAFPAGRFGGLAVQEFGESVGAQITLSSVNGRVIGFAFQVDAINNNVICQLLDAGTAQVDLRLTSSGFFQVTRNGTILQTSATTYAVNTWYYIEFKVTIDPTNGVYQVRVGGTTIISGIGNTQNSANTTFNQIRICCTNNRGNFDDLYILSIVGAINNNFLGECRVFTTLPNSDGTTTQWTPSTGVNHWANIDDSPSPNDDTDYNSSATVGQVDLVKFPAISPTGSIIGVQTVITARKDDVGVRTLCDQCVSGVTTNSGSVTMTLNSTYGMSKQIRETDPNTSAAWTLAALNAANFGYKLLS